MASSCDEGEVATLFTEGVSSTAERELTIDETASTVSPDPNVCVVPGVSMAVREGEESSEEFVDHLSCEESAASHFVLEGEADEIDSSVDILSGITADSDVESEG